MEQSQSFELMRRLRALWPRLEGDAVYETWERIVFAGHDFESVSEAIDSYICESKWTPTPADILGRIQKPYTRGNGIPEPFASKDPLPDKVHKEVLKGFLAQARSQLGVSVPEASESSDESPAH